MKYKRKFTSMADMRNLVTCCTHCLVKNKSIAIGQSCSSRTRVPCGSWC